MLKPIYLLLTFFFITICDLDEGLHLFSLIALYQSQKIIARVVYHIDTYYNIYCIIL